MAKKKPKARNPIAHDMHTNPQFAPKVIVSKSKLHRKKKHKGKDNES